MAGPKIHAPSEVTPASQWSSAATDGIVIELPSGNRARIRRTLDMPALLHQGKIPNPLANHVREALRAQQAMPQIKGDDEAVLQLLEFVDSQVVRIFVEPKVQAPPEDWDFDKDGSFVPDEGCIAINYISWDDKMYAFAYAQGSALDLERFRAASRQAVADLQDGSGVAGDTGQTSGGDGSVGSVVSERSSVDVRRTRREQDGGSSSRPRKASAATSRKANGAKSTSAAKKKPVKRK